MARAKADNTSVVEPFTVEKVRVPVDLCDQNPYQPRTIFDDDFLAQLGASIKANGLDKTPTARLLDGRYQIAEGGQRLMAYQRLAVTDREYFMIPLEMKDYDDLEMALAAMRENKDRKDLTPFEEARWYKMMVDTFPKMTVTKLGEHVGLNKSTISYAISTVGLPEEVLSKCEEVGVSLGAARELLCLQGKEHSHPEVMLRVIATMAEQGTFTRQATIDILGRAFQSEYSMKNLEGEWRTLQKNQWGGTHFNPDIFMREHKEHTHNIPGQSPATCDHETWERMQAEADKRSTQRKTRQAKPLSTAEALARPAPEPVPELPDEPKPEDVPHAGDDVAAGLIMAVNTMDALVTCVVGTCRVHPEDVDIEGLDEDDTPLSRMMHHVAGAHDFAYEDLEASRVFDQGDGMVTFSLQDGREWLRVKFEQYRTPAAQRPEPEPEPEVRLTMEQLTRLLPKPTDGPVVAKKWLPEGFDFAAQQKALKDIREFIDEGGDVSVVPDKFKKELALALGSRAGIHESGSRSYDSYKDLTPSNLGEVTSPRECVEKCTWGMCLTSGRTYGEGGTFKATEGDPTSQAFQMTCLNMGCFRSKQRVKTAAKRTEGDTNIGIENTALDLAAREMVARGSVDLGEKECLLLLEMMSKGSFYSANSMVGWSRIMAKYMGLEDEQAKGASWATLRTAIHGRSLEDNRYLFSVMLLERNRSHEKPVNWKPELYGRLDALGLGHVKESAESGEPQEGTPAPKRRRGRPKKETAKA